MQVRGKAVAGADLDRVVAGVVVIDGGERAVDTAIHRMVRAAAVIAERGEEIRRAERRRPAPEKDPLEVANGAEQLAPSEPGWFSCRPRLRRLRPHTAC